MRFDRRQWILGGTMASLSALSAGVASPGLLARANNWKGKTKGQLPTPCLVLDLDKFETNIEKMRRAAQEAGVDLRPHAKTHKCSQIAKAQIGAAALGVCAATISEAERLATAGVTGILITSEIVGPEKTGRLLALTRQRPETMSVVDSIEQARSLNQAAREGGVHLPVLIDVDPGGRRTGVAPGEPAIELAMEVDRLDRLQLKGMHSYSGGSAHVIGFEARKQHSQSAMEAPLQTFRYLKSKGLPVETCSGGSTGTYNIFSHLDGPTEMQVGSYVFMDVDYIRIGGRNGDVYDDFQPSLTVIATVISRNHKGRATLDAGYKALATDRDFGPTVIDPEGVEYRFSGDEHGILTFDEASHEIRLGDRVELIVPHCDPNVNLYDHMYCVRSGVVEDVWTIDARGHV